MQQAFHRYRVTSSSPHRSRLGAACAIAVASLVTVVGCSSSGSSTAKSAPTTTSPSAPQTVTWKPPACHRTIDPTPAAKPVAGTPSDYDITSFDGATIRAHWFPLPANAAKSAPTIMMGPGWSLPGDTNLTAAKVPTAMSVLTIPALRKAGYNVLTWDPRGFGNSTGTVEVDSPDFEGKDTSILVDWLAAQKGVELDAKGDPRIGMVGASYGGGIQFVAAAIDCRIDAITPTIAWNSLATSLYKAETVKAGWANILVSIAPGKNLDPHILSADEAGKTNGDLTDADRLWFVDRGPDDLLSKITVPTLIVQGTVDNLFPLSEGDQNFTQLSQNGIPLSMVWYCGGHGACLNKADPIDYVSNAVTNWLDRYVKRTTTATPVPVFKTTDQNGRIHTYDTYPVVPTRPLFTMATSGTLKLQPDGGSGPVAKAAKGDVIGGLAAAITPAKATNAVNVTLTTAQVHQLLLGAPDLRIGYSGTIDGPVTKPTRIFAQLVDDATGRVVGNQVTPIQVNLDGKSHMANVNMEMIAFDAKPGAKLTLQLVASTVAYAVPQMGGTITFSRIALTVPTTKS